MIQDKKSYRAFGAKLFRRETFNIKFSRKSFALKARWRDFYSESWEGRSGEIYYDSE